MQTVHEYDLATGVATGAVRHIADHEGVQPGWTRTPPPPAEDGFVAAWGGGRWVVAEPPLPPAFDRAGAASAIDEAVAAIYGRFTRFAIEYEEREAQARAFQEAGYLGEAPPRVAEFAVPAGMPAQAATDLILAQSVSLRAAQGSLSALRMRKYEVLRAPTDEQALVVAGEILGAIALVGGQVS